MPGEEISPELRQFIHNTIESIEQLEVLLYLVSNPDRSWSAEAVSARVSLEEDLVRQILEDFRRANLLIAQGATPIEYRYAPQSSVLAQEVANSLKRAYAEGKSNVVKLIFSKPLDNIRFFADAFRIKKKE